MSRDHDVFPVVGPAASLSAALADARGAARRREFAPTIAGLTPFEPLRMEPASLPPDTRRHRIGDLDTTYHCSIVGTCLSTGELRQLLARLDVADAETASDHDLHGRGVALARNRQGGGKTLNKALDRRHQIAINQFAKAKSDGQLSALWTDAVKRGDIPGAYWAVLTHPASSETLRRRVFGEVHMLSHLVGAANRADIRRLHQLEQQNGALLAKVERQQTQLREAILSRDAKLADVTAALSQRIAADAGGKLEADGSTTALDTVVLAQERRLATEAARRERAERRLEQSMAARAAAEEACRQALRERDALRAELAAAEESLATLLDGGAHQPSLDLGGLSLLYVGGRPNQVNHLRTLAERASAHFLHHDGGIDERSGMLPGLVSRADIALFPVDCISHEAALMVKRLCRQAGKPWVPLRNASATAFLAAVMSTARAAEPAE
jgi:Uncharacterized protein conserved in bacteria (DUF2325)